MKKEIALPIVEDILKQFKFLEEYALNYHPKGVISQRRSKLERSSFQHCTTSNLTKEANSLEHDFNWNIEGRALTSQEEHSGNPIVSLPSKSELLNKRPTPEVSDINYKQ